ncbi:hypothetical protein DPMN_142310 [Dreissena polymorpha]|uniref:Uncharacterized protein n=2 Tax=Dreissena polymorpha TaxID=45954 RepID=A0A9D4GF47_DREPO|nr:hypothetical protein DPMN_142310 [Dreissena polymorpha]
MVAQSTTQESIEISNANTNVNKTTTTILTLENLLTLGPINVLSVTTEFGLQDSVFGPWEYKNARNCMLKYTIQGSDISHTIRLDSLLTRGIPSTERSSLAFRWYSWIRLKAIANQKKLPINSVLTNEGQFLSLLHEVNLYYTKSSKVCRDEGLEPNRGPQSHEDACNLERLHYYGMGTIKYYRKTTFLQLVAKRYGENVKAEYLVDPTTRLISCTDYEETLKDVHSEIIHNYSRHEKLLKNFAGPQCNEDRLNNERINFDVKFTSASSKAKQELKTDSDLPLQKVIEPTEADTSEFYLRKCNLCSKVRWLGKRAAEKFILGSYVYGNLHKQVQFSCNLLHGTSCDEENDIIPLPCSEPSPQLWVAYNSLHESKLTPVAFVLKTISEVSAGVEHVQIMAKYACTSQEFDIIKGKAVYTQSLPSACVKFVQSLTTGRFKSCKEIPTLKKGKLNIMKPREALVCQSWLDHSELSSEDPSAQHTVLNLSGIRDLHATYGAMKMIHCSQCGMCSPGFEADAANCINVPEAGQQIPMSNSFLLQALKQSQVLAGSSVTLDSAFSSARVYNDETVTGVCTNCSKFCKIDHGIVTLLHKKSAGEESSQGTTVDSQQSIDDNISNINPYGPENLMALDVFQDEASYQHEMFMDTLSQAEKLVLSPIHAVIVILRSRTNNIPFSRYGSISFAIKEPVKTKALPWHTFQKLPFVIMVSKQEDGSINEAKINMAKIVHAKELMEREVTCPVYGTKRPFYRYCDKVHTPFTVAAMENLASQLSDTSTAVYPNGLRKINVELIHERASKRLTIQLFSEWINSGFIIGSGIKDAILIENQKATSSCLNMEQIANLIWNDLAKFILESQTNDKLNHDEDPNETIKITLTDVVLYGVQRKWLNRSTDVSNASQKNIEQVLLPEDELKNLTYLCCEEIELLLRESSNDEGDSGSVAQGGVSNLSENPEQILKNGMQNTVLQRISAPDVDRQNPVAEDTQGYLQMAFPDVFLTGDACPHQERPRSIKNKSGSYKFAYLYWVCAQKRAMVNTELQFLVHSMIKREHSKGKAKLALKSDAFETTGIPVKEDLMQNSELRDWTVSNLMMFKSSIPDTAPFWKRSRDDAIAVQRDWEESVPWRKDKMPMSIMLFQTRAPPYNHHPAIHKVCPGTETLSIQSDQEFLEGRRRNVLQYPSIVSFMCALMAELDTTFLSRIRYDGDAYFTRFEWGANANPHAHRLYFSREFSQHMDSLKLNIQNCLQSAKDECLNTGQDLDNPLVQDTIRTRVLDCWDHARKDYIEYMRPFYTNWNAGLLADGKNKTFDFIYERTSAICRLNMASVIDNALTTGDFSTLDTLYVTVVNGTCRHLGHTGINDQPSKTDKCAVVKKKQSTCKETGNKQSTEVITCKRRKPQPMNKVPTIEPDKHNKKIFQLQFECNDKWFNGHDPFEILHVLSNADDKAVVPEFLRKPPVIEVSCCQNKENGVQDLNLEFFSDTGDSATEYVTKYAFKDAIPTKTSNEVLITAMEKLQDGEPINQGAVQKMYNSHAIAGTTSIFQATHLNQNIPHVLSNVNIKSCSVSGLSLLRTDYDKKDGEDYILPPLIKQFDGRHGTTAVFIECGKESPKLKAEIQCNMCLHQFCDLFDVKEIKPNDGARFLQFKRRSTARNGRLNALKLIPCHGIRMANPRGKQYWHYCRTLCLWKIPCHKTTDFSPIAEDAESLKKAWIDLFNQTFLDGNGLPPWAYKFWKHHHLPRNNNSDSDSSSDEDVEENQQACAVDATDDTNLSKIKSSEYDSASKPIARPGNEQFYQNPVDRLRSAPQQGIDSKPCFSDSDVLANPEGVDFMKSWLGENVIPSTAEYMLIFQISQTHKEFCQVIHLKHLH